MKNIFALITIVFAMAAFAGCSASDNTQTSKFTAKEVTSKVTSAMNDLNDLHETDKNADNWTNIMNYVTDIDPDKVTDIDYLYMTDGSAEEICAIIAIDEDSAKEIESDMKNRISTRKSHFETYDPEQLPKVEAAYAGRSGNTCILIIGAQAQNGKYEFNKMMGS